MQISALVVQFPVALDIERNVDAILSILALAEPDDLVVLPEGALSGYAEDPAFLREIDTVLLTESLQILRDEVMRRQVHLVFGSCVQAGDVWYNSGLYFGPCGEVFEYRKVNLATSERGRFAAGSQLPVFAIRPRGRAVKLGIQLCREIRFPEQWRCLARKGAEVICYLNNAVGDEALAPVWRSHLISRAAENQRFVLAANNAQPAQKCPSMIVAPGGQVLWEVVSPELAFGRHMLDLDKVSDWYLSQSREDVVRLEDSSGQETGSTIRQWKKH